MIGLPLLGLVSGLGPAIPVKSVSSLTSEMWSLFCGIERNLIFACGASGLEYSAAVPPAVLDTGEMVCKAKHLCFPRVTS